MTEPAAATAICPRCGAAFDCGAARAAPCACAGIALPAALLAELRARHPGRCLCLDCLRALAAAHAGPGAAAAR